MASILAKYVPGTVWIPAARIAALRRLGIRATPLVLGSMAVEAGVSGVAGIIVFLVSLTTVGFSDAPVLPLVALGLVGVVGLHPRVFTPAIRRILRPIGGAEFLHVGESFRRLNQFALLAAALAFQEQADAIIVPALPLGNSRGL